MNTRYFHIGLVLWIFAVVPPGFTESYPNRPTAGEMGDIVALGTECVLGVNERCLATQYQTNPVAYRVEPFTNTAGFYLDQGLMGTMASKIRSLVPYYVDPDTVYDGSKNIVMLTVTGLWASLGIGDRTNQFTCTPAIGTNAATYGDSPWRIYASNLQERYQVLNALKMTKNSVSGFSTTNCSSREGRAGPNYADLSAAWLAASWGGNGDPNFTYKIGGYLDNDYTDPNSMARSRGQAILSFGGISTQIIINSYAIFFCLGTPKFGGLFCETDIYGKTGYCFEIANGNPPATYTTDVFGDSESVFPNWPSGVWPPAGNPAHYSWEVNNFYLAIDWQFNYCTE